MKIIRKILFCLKITSDLSSFFRLIINSKRLSRSKSREIPPEKIDNFFPLNIRFRNISQTIFLRTYKGDIDIFYEIFFKNCYSLPIVSHDIVQIIDLGANVGLSAIYFTAVFPEAEILCVEPGKENYKMLLKNLDGQIKKGKAQVIHAAATGFDGQVSFEDGKMHYNGKIIEGRSNNTRALSMSTIFDIYKIKNVGLLKIDIEGSEEEVLSATHDWLAVVQNIVIEMHSDTIRDNCLTVLKQNHFETQKLSSDPTNHYLFWASKE